MGFEVLSESKVTETQLTLFQHLEEYIIENYSEFPFDMI